MSQGENPLAGWYVNESGQQQWWDGHQWGPVAPASSAEKQSIPYPPKNIAAVYLLLFVIGWLGAHRFYLDHVGIGIMQAILGIATASTFAVEPVVAIVPALVLGIWLFCDLVIMPDRTHKVNVKLGFAY